MAGRSEGLENILVLTCYTNVKGKAREVCKIVSRLVIKLFSVCTLSVNSRLRQVDEGRGNKFVYDVE